MKKKIYFIHHKGIIDDGYHAICTKIEQYGFDKERPLFICHDHIMVKRKPTRKEAELLLELIRPNGSGQLHGCNPKEIIEL